MGKGSKFELSHILLDYYEVNLNTCSSNSYLEALTPGTLEFIYIGDVIFQGVVT